MTKRVWLMSRWKQNKDPSAKLEVNFSAYTDNIKPLGKKQLINWTLFCARGGPSSSESYSQLLVSFPPQPLPQTCHPLLLTGPLGLS